MGKDFIKLSQEKTELCSADNGVVSISSSIVSDKIYDYRILDEALESKKTNENQVKLRKSEEKQLKTTIINNRRYLGSKYKLLEFIKSVVDKECKNISSIADIFAGTGAFASAFYDKRIITNDILYFNYICHVTWFSPEKYDKAKIKNLIFEYNNLVVVEDNYMSKNFANTYFSLDDCRKIGFIREDIKGKYDSGQINNREQAILLTSLMYAMDKIAETCGHYDAYRKGVTFNKKLELALPLAQKNNKKNNQMFNEDANELVKRMSKVDLVYIDPPYNSRQYGDAYHLLENVARWEKPAVHGVAKKMDRTSLKSAYSTNAATKAFEDLINNIKAKYILVSYNNMAEKGNSRSNAKISDKDIIRILRKKGKIKVFSESYKPFTTGKSNITENEERLFLCEVGIFEDSSFIESPLNYTGGKYKLLPQIIPLFPNNVELFVDLFCGGANVGLNAQFPQVLINDKLNLLVGLYSTFKEIDKPVLFEKIKKIIDEYKLSDSTINGYDFYGCNSSDGLGSYNKPGYMRLRNDFNNIEERDFNYYIKFYVLIVYSFNNQIRFNSQGKFNLPVGKRDFNKKMQMKLDLFIDRIKEDKINLSNKDFRVIDTSAWNDKTFVYCDPPYLITCATYNERDGWNEELEKELLTFLDQLTDKGIKFALSNVLRSKGKANDILLNWINENKKKYRVINLNFDYSNSNYQLKNKNKKTQEVLIINYWRED